MTKKIKFFDKKFLEHYFETTYLDPLLHEQSEHEVFYGYVKWITHLETK